MGAKLGGDILDREALIKEIETLPPDFVGEVYRYVLFVKEERKSSASTGRRHISLKERLKDYKGDYKAEEWDTGEPVRETVLASEQSLAKDWLLAEEDIAWANL